MATIKGTTGTDYLLGTPEDDEINGGGGSDYITGYAGNDILRGGYGADFLSGGEGDDRLFGGAGDDELVGGLGHNIIDGGTGDDTYRLGYGTYDIRDPDGIDTLYTGRSIDLADYDGSGIDVFVMSISGGNGTATGTDGSDEIVATGNRVVLDGLGGDDFLFGGDGSNEVYIGGLGRDVMDSGAKDFGPPWWGQHSGLDRFDFLTVEDSAVGAGRDVIYNFLEGGGAGGDLVNLGRIDADQSVGGNQAFTHIGIADFSGTAGELRVVFGDETLAYLVVSGDVDGDGLADFEIEVHTQGPNRYLAEDSFIL